MSYNIQSWGKKIVFYYQGFQVEDKGEIKG